MHVEKNIKHFPKRMRVVCVCVWGKSAENSVQ